MPDTSRPGISRSDISRSDTSRSGITAANVTIGDYFTAVHTFLYTDNGKLLADAMTKQTGGEILPGRIEKIDIFLIKHGRFYHPALIKTTADTRTCSFVLNVAVSEEGNACIETEYELLKKLGQIDHTGCLPQVYGKGRFFTDHGCEIQMFSGLWFDNFFEFHISKDHKTDQNRIIVWDQIRGNKYIAAESAARIYHNAAKILTSFYNPETFEQIFSWHHAAGDFVVCIDDKENVEVKLITVRRYAPMIDLPESGIPDPIDSLHGLLLFLINISIRTRFDRLDGIGKPVWADEIAVESTVKGFFEALSQKSPLSGIELPLADLFHEFVLRITPSEFYEAVHEVTDSYNSKSPEIRLFSPNFVAHASKLYQALGHDPSLISEKKV
ncbi:hypothetical protein QUF76_15440 [Desulfobacterales bacterium HSG16]|nr:hypothetical protein [Desulfobacterales bacterium HSG16]